LKKPDIYRDAQEILGISDKVADEIERGIELRRVNEVQKITKLMYIPSPRPRS